MTLNEDYRPVFQTTRGKTVESVHFGAIAVADVQGNLIACYGSPKAVTFLRSAAKPFQALPFVEKGGPDSFGLIPKEIAIMCASHSGTDEHFRVLRQLQKKIGISQGDLLCGTHRPIHKPTAALMVDRGEQLTPNRHNCSGKHTGMLAHAILEKASLNNYVDPEHPIQRSILEVFSEMCSVDASDIKLGIDGCSAPVFAIPMVNAAMAWARLVDSGQLSPRRAAACRTISSAMTAHPLMVAGPDRFDTRLMKVTQGRILAKGGAEAYQGIGIPPGGLGEDSPGLGIAVKIADGDTRRRAKTAVVMDVLRQLGALTDQEMAALADFGPTCTVRNYRNLVVGRGQPCFQLEGIPGQISRQ